MDLTQKMLCGKSSIDFQTFSEFNKEVSSDILLSVMSILENRLPCSKFYFREIEIFKENLIFEELNKSPYFT